METLRPGRQRERAKVGGAPPAGARVVYDSPCPPGHNTPLPLKRSPPVSFKRLLGIRPTEEAGMDDLELWKHMAKALSQICDAVNLLRKPDPIHAPAILVWREDFGELAPSDLPPPSPPPPGPRLNVSL